jgi:uncharacterized protein (TIGR03083 family)
MTQTGPRMRAATRPRTSTLDRATLMRLAATEYERVTAMLAGLTAQDWARPTECPGWDVRAMAGHVLGMAEMAASIRESVRQQRVAGKRDEEGIDALTALQVEEHADLTAQQVVDGLRRVGPRAARARRRTPGLIRRLRLPERQVVGGTPEAWTFGFLIDTILTRDPWMHRIDIARATGREPHLTADHDAVLVADVVTEWAARHGRPCQLRLTGPAGGSWTFGTGGQGLELDAIDFCRTLSRREHGEGLLDTEVPF